MNPNKRQSSCPSIGSHKSDAHDQTSSVARMQTCDKASSIIYTSLRFWLETNNAFKRETVGNLFVRKSNLGTISIFQGRHLQREYRIQRLHQNLCRIWLQSRELSRLAFTILSASSLWSNYNLSQMKTCILVFPLCHGTSCLPFLLILQGPYLPWLIPVFPSRQLCLCSL